MYDKLVVYENLGLGFTDTTLACVFVMLVVILFRFGLRLDIASYFKKDTTKLKPLLTALGCQMILIPAVICLLLVLLQDLIPTFTALGVLFAACCPISPRVLYFAKESRCDLVTLERAFGISTLLCFITMPLSFSVWGNLYLKILEQNADTMLNATHVDFLYIFRAFFLIAMVPVSFGVVFRNLWPRQSKNLIKPLMVFSHFFRLVLAAFVLIANYKYVLPRFGCFLIIAIGFHVLASVIGSVAGIIGHFPISEKRCIMFATTFYGSGLGLCLLMNRYIFPPETFYTNEFLILAFITLWSSVAGFLNKKLLVLYDKYNAKKALTSNL